MSENWPRVALRELATNIKDGTHGTHPRVETGVPLLSAKNISDAGKVVVLDNEELIDEHEYHLITSGFAPQPGDLLITIVGSIGRRAIFNGSKVAFQRSVAFVRPRNEILVDYLFQAVGSDDFARQLAQRSNATAQTGLYLGELAKVTVPLPSRATQRRIAEILSTVDEAIEQTEALIAKYQQIKAGLTHDLFTRGLSSEASAQEGVTWKLRPTRDSIRTRFGWMPKDWRVGSLLDVADPNRQPILTGPFGAELGNDDFVTEGVAVLRIGNVQLGYLDLSDLLYVTKAKAHELERYKVKEGDLLFARQGATTGRNALANRHAEGYLINYHIIRVALDHSMCSPIFIEAAFNGEIVKRQIERDKGRGTREGINTTQLKALELPLAPAAEQRVIAEILLIQGAVLAEVQNQLEKLQQQKQGLMHDLLTGRVRVKVAESARL